MLPAGEQIGQFTVIRLLGRGGMGDVYLARDATLGRRVALKVIQPERLGSAALVDRFLFEARTTARFSHPHIVTVYAAGVHQGCPYLALEYLEGVSLRERTAEPWPAVREIVRIGLAIASALVEAHANNVLHRDLKPENVLIPRDGRPRVVDFGIAKMIGETEIANAASAPHRDGEATAPPSDDSTTLRPAAPAGTRPLFGTPLYMAPEQWNGEENTGATDVWALGMILYELLAHSHPYADLPIARLSQRVTDSSPVPPLPPHDDQPAELVALVAACLAKKPGQRPTAANAVDRLESLLAPRRAAEGADSSPFRGLLSFGEQHADFFFGRDDEIAAFVERLRDEPVMPVVGPSGAGKSSFVQAGVIPRLRDQGAWTVLRARPGARPFSSLAACLTGGGRPDHFSPVSPPADANAAGTTVKLRRQPAPVAEPVVVPPQEAAAASDDLATELHRRPGLLALLLLHRAESEQRRVLLFVDQLEELCTMVADAEVQRRFMQAICGAADDRQGPVRVIFALRDDFLGRLALGAEARAALGRVTVLRAPAPHELEQILVQPLAAVGYRFDDEALPAQIVQQVQQEAACLPLLQFAASLLWSLRDRGARLIRRAAYDEMGAVPGALARHADHVIGGLTPPQKRQARHLLLRLVTADGIRRALDRERALAGLGAGAEAVLERLIEARLLVVRQSGDPDAGASLELAHDALISHWQQLSRWIDDSRNELRLLAEIEQAAAQWWRRGQRASEVWRGDELRTARRALEATGVSVSGRVARFIQAGLRREQRALRQRRLLVAGLVAVAVCALAGLGFMISQQSRLNARLAEVQLEAAHAARASERVLEARARVRSSLEVEDSTAARLLWWQLCNQPIRWSHATGERVASLHFAGTDLRVELAGKDWQLAIDLATGVARTATDVSPAAAHRGSASATSRPDGPQRFYSADRSHYATIEDRTVRIWDAADGKVQNSLVLRLHDPMSALFSPGGDQLVAFGGAGEMQLWSWRQGGGAPLLGQHSAATQAAVFFPDGRRLATAAQDRTIKIWDLVERRQLRELPVPGNWAYWLALDDSSDLLAAATASGDVHLWNLAVSPAAIQRPAPTGSERPLFASTGNRLFSVDSDRSISVWDLASGARVGRLSGHREPVAGVTCDGSGRRLASVGLDNTVRIWDLETLAPERIFVVDTRGARGLAFASAGLRLIVGGRDHRARLLDLRSGAVVELVGHRDAVHGGAFSPDATQVATASADGTVGLWDAGSGRFLGTLVRFDLEVLQVDWDRRGDHLACGLADGSVRWIDRASGATLSSVRLEGQPSALRFDHRGGQIAVVASDRSVWVWRPAEGALTRMQQRSGRGGDPVFSDDDTHLAVSGRAPAIWRIADGRPLQSSARGLALLTEGGANWDRVLAHDALGASLGERNQRLCLWTYDGAVELWDIARDERRFGKPIEGVRDVVAAGFGCAVRTGDRVYGLDEGGSSRFELTVAADALAARGQQLFVASGGRVTVYDQDGALLRDLAVGPGATALLPTAEWLAVGNDRGHVELVPMLPGRKRPRTVFDAVSESAVVALASGPAGLLVGGFANGALVLWDLRTGRQIERYDFMAAVGQVAIDGQRCIAISEAGELLLLDLAPLVAGECELLREVWQQVPIVWDDGPRIAAPLASHRCQRRW
ncbi:MAG: protein kinase [Deltaproteobacteria bacterium]|nr:protein kinase [Deltaproteobacteria bacterium]